MKTRPPAAPATPSYHPDPSRPALQLPRGACDAHVHVFGPVAKFPFAPQRSFTPADASKETLFALHARLGIDRCVVVQSSCHGFDNSATEDALAARPGACRGVALLPLDVGDTELHRLDRAGFCAVRFNFMRHLGTAAPIAEVIAFCSRLADLGWHLQVHFESSLVHDLSASLRRSPVPVVIDHMGRVDAALGLDHPDFQQLLRLLDNQKIWVKVSGSERLTREPAPYAPALPFAQRLIQTAGDRVLWGTDWPHPNLANAVPDDGQLVDLIARFAPEPAVRQALLVDNPQRLYRFAPLTP